MTRINLEEPFQGGYPVVKRTALGQTFNGAIIKSESRDRLKRAADGTMTPIVKANGKHSQELVVTCLTLPGTTAPAGIRDDESVPQPGDIVRLILKGKSFGDWIESKRQLPNGVVAVGDVVTQKTNVAQVYDASGNAYGGEITDQQTIDGYRAKGRSIGIYGPLTLAEPEDGSEWTAKAVSAYRGTLVAEKPVSKETVWDEPDASPSDVGWPEPVADTKGKPANMPLETWLSLPAEARAALGML
jgi:hypothetical protein